MLACVEVCVHVHTRTLVWHAHAVDKSVYECGGVCAYSNVSTARCVWAYVHLCELLIEVVVHKIACTVHTCTYYHYKLLIEVVVYNSVHTCTYYHCKLLKEMVVYNSVHLHTRTYCCKLLIEVVVWLENSHLRSSSSTRTYQKHSPSKFYRSAPQIQVLVHLYTITNHTFIHWNIPAPITTTVTLYHCRFFKTENTNAWCQAMDH